jgi:hypothetical protein
VTISYIYHPCSWRTIIHMYIEPPQVPPMLEGGTCKRWSLTDMCGIMYMYINLYIHPHVPSMFLSVSDHLLYIISHVTIAYMYIPPPPCTTYVNVWYHVHVYTPHVPLRLMSVSKKWTSHISPIFRPGWHIIWPGWRCVCVCFHTAFISYSCLQ